VNQLVAQGYKVRGTARNSQIVQVQAAYDKAYGSEVEVFRVDDLATGDYTAALAGVDAVIHLAMPVATPLDAKSAIHAAKGGTMNLIVQAYKAGVKRFSIASSLAACTDDQTATLVRTWTHEDWNDTTEDEASTSDKGAFFGYSAAKALMEKAAWEFVKEHQEVSLTTVCPPFFVGPFAPGHVIKPWVVEALSTNAMLHSVLIPGDVLGSPAFGFVDVRDVAKAQVAGIKTPGHHRVLIGSPEWFDLRNAVDHLTTARPGLKDRLANPVSMERTVPAVDNARAINLLGVSVTPWRKTVEDGIDSLLRVEKEWEEAGVHSSVLQNNAMRLTLLGVGEALSKANNQAQTQA